MSGSDFSEIQRLKIRMGFRVLQCDLCRLFEAEAAIDLETSQSPAEITHVQAKLSQKELSANQVSICSVRFCANKVVAETFVAAFYF